jgi:hypothetical protein
MVEASEYTTDLEMHNRAPSTVGRRSGRRLL